MRIIEYFTAENKEHWLGEIEKCDWGAGQYLHQLLRENSLKEAVGETALVPMLVDEDELIAFCTFAPLDDIQPTDLSPWIGFVYTFPRYRGHRYGGMLLDYAESLATVMGREYIYISTGHTGLYEKYGYEFYKMAKDIEGEDSRVYRKALNNDGPDRDRRYENGAVWKAEIVEAARKGVDMTAYCGFSCNHCFLGEWCGGCRSVFNCCSYGTLYEKGKCPNIACCREKGIDGCYECGELDVCTRGFYQPDNDGAGACKAQAMFIRRYGKEKFFGVQDKLHENYDFKKTQEILGQNTEEGLKILERYLELTTKRLILRPWQEEDAQSLYQYAKDPEVGPAAGWPVHTSVENSLEIIRTVLSAPETYAVCLKEDNKAIGSIGLFSPTQSHTAMAEDELEIGYWIGSPFWGKGYIPEAVRRLQKYAFEELGCKAMWCGYYDGNEKSKRCQEKCGFVYHHTEENRPCTLMGDVRTEHFNYLSKEQWAAGQAGTGRCSDEENSDC